MAVIDAMRAAILRVDGSQVNNVFGSNNQIAVEMADLVNDVARDIALSHEWRALQALIVVVGDGERESFALPADFDRMTLTGGVESASPSPWGYRPFRDINDWARAGEPGFLASPGGWIIVGKEIHFRPAPTGEARFPYIRKAVVDSSGGEAKDAFSADDDEFRLNERLLTLGLVWRWKAQKGLQYAEDMQTYELALNQEQAKERGARMIGEPGPRFRGAHPAWPWELR